MVQDLQLHRGWRLRPQREHHPEPAQPAQPHLDEPSVGDLILLRVLLDGLYAGVLWRLLRLSVLLRL